MTKEITANTEAQPVEENPAPLGDLLKNAATLAEKEQSVEKKEGSSIKGYQLIGDDQKEPQAEKPVRTEAPINAAQDKVQNNTPTSAKEQKQNASDASQEAPLTKEHEALQANYSKLETSLAETRKWGRDLSQKLKKFAAQIEAYKTEGVLTPEEADHLIAKTSHGEESVEDTPLMHYSKIWDQELDNIRKYSPEPDLDQHVLAFQHLLKNATPAELEELLEDFALEKDPIKLTRLMLAKGQEYHQEIYKDLQETGSLKGFKKAQEAKLKKQQKEIEKLRQELARFQQDQDYIGSSKYSLPSGSNAKVPEQDMTLNHLLGEAKSGRLMNR